jgi:hypothetical protein
MSKFFDFLVRYGEKHYPSCLEQLAFLYPGVYKPLNEEATVVEPIKSTKATDGLRKLDSQNSEST